MRVCLLLLLQIAVILVALNSKDLLSHNFCGSRQESRLRLAGSFARNLTSLKSRCQLGPTSPQKLRSYSKFIQVEFIHVVDRIQFPAVELLRCLFSSFFFFFLTVGMGSLSATCGYPRLLDTWPLPLTAWKLASLGEQEVLF